MIKISKSLTVLLDKVVLIMLFALCFMFSLSAQTPRKDSGANGLNGLIALNPGEPIPDAVWSMPLELNYFDGKKKTVKLADYRNKLIILDFWSTGCASCIEGIPKMELYQQRFKDDVIVLLVNSKRNKDTAKRIKTRFEKYRLDFNYTPILPTILDDTVFTTLIEHNTLPRIAIINKAGIFIGTNSSASLSEQHIKTMLKTGKLPYESEKNILNKVIDHVDMPLLIDTVGLSYTSTIARYKVNYNGIYPNVHYKNGQTLLQTGNASVRSMYQNAFSDVFKDKIYGTYVFHSSVPPEFKKLLNDPNTFFWYQYFNKDSVDNYSINQAFRRALIDNFGVDVKLKFGFQDVYILKIDPSNKNILSKGGMRIHAIEEGSSALIMQNAGLVSVANFLRTTLDRPVLVEGKNPPKVDLMLPSNFYDLDNESKIRLLSEKGLILSKSRNLLEYPFFYKPIE
ncbi:MAG: TlpA family protein disulfide reductase [Sphingobacterium sp.]